jgi:hypothetical protein
VIYGGIFLYIFCDERNLKICSVRFVEVLSCSMVQYIPKAEFHTIKSVLGCISVLESCFPVKVWIFVLGAMTFVVL